MKKAKQILALCGVILILGLLIVAFVCALIDDTPSMTLFFAAIVASVMIPTLLWIYLYIYKLMHKKEEPENDQSEKPED